MEAAIFLRVLYAAKPYLQNLIRLNFRKIGNCYYFTMYKNQIFMKVQNVINIKFWRVLGFVTKFFSLQTSSKI
ncbi:MAG: hypothetical protein A3I24_01760 [Candidatus Harrisonbacteria bacterium RIFCSPLOWO2_02_FULL_41_13b]|uniref:Uncharacterized protein n=1 Tax=Candidatus Harrisonbacteria bacterium RIFCSPLOWO2_02_FULL_41_13b TaxID=1798409 RepID=A0A1G1ZW09_9BACT|nr:MAG: hypothetical protein A3J53_01180 [Candidatus Harrisonbacteria bacterium RIFCSPHIGHO2_02_FULL_40_20]OGY68326.1 MAG: hypothetical protein A3I24_01760 [Candidatus Harrisonbacteria bacterium RIFCSPLOWO2_02_FULL_41_13b]